MKLADGKSGNAWFAFGEEAPLSFFAGLRTSWHGTRRKDEGPLDHELFAFFTTTPNVEVAAVHMKAMPVILRSIEEWNAWLRAPWSEAKALQLPLPDGSLDRVAELPVKVVPACGRRSAAAQCLICLAMRSVGRQGGPCVGFAQAAIIGWAQGGRSP